MQCLSRMCTLQLLRRIMIFTGHGRCVRVHNEIQCMKCVRNVPGLVGLKKKKKTPHEATNYALLMFFFLFSAIVVVLLLLIHAVGLVVLVKMLFVVLIRSLA